MAEKNKVIILVLIMVILILAGILVYTMVIRPSITGYTVSAQQQGYALAIAQVIQLVSQCQPVPLNYGNVTVNVIAIECLQQQPQQ